MGHHRNLTLLLTASILLLTGCNSKNQVVNYDTPGKASHNLLFFGNKYEAANVEVIESILTGYMEENTDIIISYESLKGSDYYDALTRREASGNLDDVFMINHDTSLLFSSHGSLADLSDLAEQIPFSDSMLSQMEAADGRIYWVPTTVSAFGLYCNIDLLKQHGQPVPTTLSEWESVCCYFISHDITPIIANNDISIKTLVLARAFYPLYQNGIQLEAFEKLNSGQEKLSDYLGESFALVQSFCEKGYIDARKALETQKTSDDLAEFAKGESPFMLTGVWAAGRVKDMEPGFTFQVVPYPVMEEGTVLVINPDVRLSISKESVNLDLAREFVAYFLREENISRFADNQSSFSPLEDSFQPSLSEIQCIVEDYHTHTPVIGSDSHIEFSIWDITADASRELLSGDDLQTLLERMDERVLQEIRQKETYHEK